MRRFILAFFAFFCLLALLAPPVFAEETQNGDTLPKAYQDLLNALPPAILERLPEGTLSSSAEEVGGAV